jgi:hypothetical protein
LLTDVLALGFQQAFQFGRLIFVCQFRRRQFMKKRKIAERVVATPAQLDELIEEATVDCHDDNEQASGFFNMIEDALALPFVTRILGVEVSVVAVDMGDDGSLKAVCECGGERQRIALLDLPLPPQLPAGAQWISAYRRWLIGR